MAQAHPEPGSWMTVKSQDLMIGDEIWVDGEWMFIVNGVKLNFRINGDVMIKERGR